MKRREALKNIGLSAGSIAVTPTFISLLQSCQNKAAIDWTPEFLTMDEAKALDKIVDLIIPETDNGIPGAKAMNVPLFIDKYANNVLEVEEAGLFKSGAGIMLEALGVSEEKPVTKITTEEYDKLLTENLKMPKEKQMEYRMQLYEAIARENPDAIPREVLLFNFLAGVRDLSIHGYKTSAYIGEEVLAYLPVPGEQVGCDSLDTLSGGKAWSL